MIQAGEPMKEMKRHRFKKVFLGFLLGMLFSGEVLFSLYGNFQGSADSIQRQREKAIDDFRLSKEAVKRQRSRDADIRQLEENSELKKRQNEMALAAGRPQAKLNDENFRKDKEAKAKLIAQYDAWEKEQLFPTLKFYEEKAARASEGDFLGLLTGIQFGISASLLAIGLAYLASRQNDFFRWFLLGLSFIAQFAACTMIYEGAMLKFSNELIAKAFSVMFLACTPFTYHFGLLDFSNDAPVVTPTETKTVTKPETVVTIAKTTVKHTSVTFSFPHTVDGWQSAISEIVKERKAGNGQNLVAATARYFVVNKGVVSRAVGRALRGEPINVPTKLLVN